MTKDLNELVLGDFPFQTFDKLRYADTDRQGHVNNAVFSTFIETGRVEFLLNPEKPLTDDRASFVIAQINLSLLGEINWPGRIDIGTGITKIGNSSIGMYQALFQLDKCVARAETVIVQMHDETRKSHPLTEKTRAFLTDHLLEI